MSWMLNSPNAEQIVAELHSLEFVVASGGDAAHDLAKGRAKSIKDQTLKQFVVRESNPAYVLERIAAIRALMAGGDANAAGAALHRLKQNLDLISQIVRAPAIRTGHKQREKLAELRDVQNKRASKERAAKAAHWQQEADRIWTSRPRLSKLAVAKIVKQRLAATDTVDWISRNIKKVRTPC